jgi:hypothetical protein
VQIVNLLNKEKKIVTPCNVIIDSVPKKYMAATRFVSVTAETPFSGIQPNTSRHVRFEIFTALTSP